MVQFWVQFGTISGTILDTFLYNLGYYFGYNFVQFGVIFWVQFWVHFFTPENTETKKINLNLETPLCCGTYHVSGVTGTRDARGRYTQDIAGRWKNENGFFLFFSDSLDDWIISDSTGGDEAHFFTESTVSCPEASSDWFGLDDDDEWTPVNRLKARIMKFERTQN